MIEYYILLIVIVVLCCTSGFIFGCLLQKLVNLVRELKK